VEVHIYFFTNFKVQRNKDNYRVVSDIKIMLPFLTIVRALEEECNEIRRHRFDFVDLEKLHIRTNDSILTDDIVNFI